MSHSRAPIPYLTEALVFPPATQAGAEGILAVGGDLSAERLLLAYESGIFPWFDDDHLIIWWSPDPRMVLFPEEIKISKSLRRLHKKNSFTITRNKAFEPVIEACAEAPRKGQKGTWITPGMKQAYMNLHKLGKASSYEVWRDNELVGGLYGVDLGYIFCGESMFSKVSNASKLAFVHMVEDMQQRGVELIDCQVHTQHLERLGAREIPRDEFLDFLKRNKEGTV